MKRIPVFLLLPLFSGIAFSASLQDGEWFIDADPGVGSGVSFVPSAGTPVTISAAVIDALPPGVHLLGVRLRDDEGAWSHTVWRSFYREEVADEPAALADGEWFFDTDPGAGEGASFTTSTGSFSIDLNPGDLEELVPGIHLLGVRLRDSHGRWGQTVWRTFYKEEEWEEAPPIASFEYRIVRDDEVVATATAFPDAPASVVNLLVAHGKEGL